MIAWTFAGLLLALTCIPVALGDAYPERPIRLIVSYRPAGEPTLPRAR